MTRTRAPRSVRAAVAALLLAALAVAALSLPVAGASVAAPPVRIILVGDSMTEGSSGDWTWRYRLARYLDASGVDYEFVGPRTTMLDLATNEHTSTEYVDPAFDRDHFARWGESLHLILKPNAEVPEDSIGWAVSTYQPDVVVELLGINDLLFGSPPQETLDVARAFVDEVRAAKPDTTLVMSTVPGEQYAHVADYNDLLRAQAAGWSLPESPVVVSDPAPGWSVAADTCDHTHPSPTGDIRIAAAEQDTLATLGIGAPAPRPLPTSPPGPRRPAVLHVAPGNGQAVMTWQLPPGGTDVLISVRNVTERTPWQQLPFPVSGTSWLSDGLQNGHTYEYRLNVLKHDCVAADVVSNVVRVTPEPDAPGAVAGLHASPRDHGLRATWSQTDRATAYTVWVKPAGSQAWTTYRTTARALEVPGLDAGRRYAVAVQARGHGGAGPRSAPVRTTPTGARPTAPRWRSADATPHGTVTLRWTAARHANGYQVSYRVDRPGTSWARDPRRFDSRAAVVTGLRDGVRYVFRVRGADDRLPGRWSTGQVVRVPRVGPVRDVVAHALDDGRVRSVGAGVREADAFTLTSVETRTCARQPAGSRFSVVATGLAAPRHAFVPPTTDRAVWVRWRASYAGVPGGLVASSTACLSR